MMISPDDTVENSIKTKKTGVVFIYRVKTTLVCEAQYNKERC